MIFDPTPYSAIESVSSSPNFSTDGNTLFHLRGAGLQQVRALDLATGQARQLTRRTTRRSPYCAARRTTTG